MTEPSNEQRLTAFIVIMVLAALVMSLSCGGLLFVVSLFAR